MNRRRKKPNKKKVTDIRFPSPLAAILIVVGILSLVYLWLCGRCETLGKQIAKLEKTKLEVHRRVLNEEYKWCKKKTPQSIEGLLRHHRLSMVPPVEEKIVRVQDRSAYLKHKSNGVNNPQVAQVTKRSYE